MFCQYLLCHPPIITLSRSTLQSNQSLNNNNKKCAYQESKKVLEKRFNNDCAFLKCVLFTQMWKFTCVTGFLAIVMKCQWLLLKHSSLFFCMLLLQFCFNFLKPNMSIFVVTQSIVKSKNVFNQLNVSCSEGLFSFSLFRQVQTWAFNRHCTIFRCKMFLFSRSDFIWYFIEDIRYIYESFTLAKCNHNPNHRRLYCTNCVSFYCEAANDGECFVIIHNYNKIFVDLFIFQNGILRVLSGLFKNLKS